MLWRIFSKEVDLGLCPRPRDLSLCPNPEAGELGDNETGRPLRTPRLGLGPWIGARVASQRCPILRQVKLQDKRRIH